MPRRNDSLGAPGNPVGLRVEIDVTERDGFRDVADSLGWTMSSLIRLMVQQANRHPKKFLKEIPKNQEYHS